MGLILMIDLHNKLHGQKFFMQFLLANKHEVLCQLIELCFYWQR